METATVLSRAQHGMDAPLVRVEAHICPGTPRFTIVGLPEAVVKESKDRVRAAISSCGYEFPPGHIIVNLSPADLPKEGVRFDLPIAVGILIASGQLQAKCLDRCELYGELSLGGDLRPVKGALLAAVAAARCGHSMIIPAANACDTELVSGCEAAVAEHLLDVTDHARGAIALELKRSVAPACGITLGADLCEVRGQAQAKRALEVAAAGEHSLLLIGPPGTGKSMLAQRLPSLLPIMSEAEALEVAAVRSIAGMPFKTADWRVRPFRSPHHTASAVALTGGGSIPRPGEISLAHNGVLFLDELPEFERRVLDALREPLETGLVTVSRAARQAEFPASFQLIAAMNPCPCGYLGDPRANCRCTGEQIERYRGRLSGPLLDRLDMHIEVLRVPVEELRGKTTDSESSTTVASRVVRARELQLLRQGVTNSRLNNREVERFCSPTREALAILDRASTTLGLSARAYHRIIKVARTIADLGGAGQIGVAHTSEAMALRRLDRGRSSRGAA